MDPPKTPSTSSWRPPVPALSAYAPLSRSTLIPRQHKGSIHRLTQKLVWTILFLSYYYWNHPHHDPRQKLRLLWSKIISILGIDTPSSSLLNGVKSSDGVLDFVVSKLITRWSDRQKKVNLLHSCNTNNKCHPPPMDSMFQKDLLTQQSNNTKQPISYDTSLPLHQHRHQIDSVLNYWFGQYTPDKSQKQLWMIASSSCELLVQIDADITHKFEPLLIELTRSTNDAGDDNSVCDGASTLQIWCGCDNGDSCANTGSTGLFGWEGKLAAIIVLDQMSRHIHRHYTQQNKTNNTKSPPSSSLFKHLPTSNTQILTLPNQNKCDKLAHQISQSFQQIHKTQISTGMIPTPMLIFSLMPYRHTSTLSNVGYVQAQVESMSKMHSMDLENMIRRFRSATNRRMAVLQDEARRSGKSTVYDPNVKEDDGCIDDSVVDDSVVDGSNTADDGNGGKIGSSINERIFNDEDILEVPALDADMSNASEHSVTKAMMNYLASHGIHPLKQNKNKKRNGRNGSNDDQSNTSSAIDHNVGSGEPNDIKKSKAVIVSLSGGVDSMVIAHVLSHLRDKCHYGHLYLMAVHIDYGNRPESAAEASFVKDYSENVLKFDKFIIRRIDEVTRGVTARDEYERISRTVRYDLYRKAVAECLDQCCGNGAKVHTTAGDSTDSSVVLGVMLGHHRGDLVENVLSNSHKGCGPLDLSGMLATSRNDGVTICRPLLPLDKTNIYDYSHQFGVPYFKDTTPHWSTRGKLRNKLLPLLEEIYGDGCLMNLATLAEESDEARQLLNHAVLKPFMDQVSYYPMGLIFHTKPFQDQGPYFWKISLRDVLHSAGRGMFGDKTVTSFLERVFAKNMKHGWLQCRKDYAVYLAEDGRVYVFHPSSFPWSKSDQYNSSIGQVVEYGADNAIHIGPWRVCAERVSFGTTREEAVELLEKKVFQSWDDLMLGYLEYYVKVPINDSEINDMPSVQPLVVVKEYKRDSRPNAWKNIDVKVQSILPLLGNDEHSYKSLTALDKMHYNSNWTIVKVSLTLEHSDSA